MARPKSVTTKTHELHVRVDDETMKQLDKVCRRSGITKASAVRCSICSFADANASNAFSKEDEEVIRLFMQLMPLLSKLMLQMKRIGVNINQIAKRNNSNAGIAQGITAETIAELHKIQMRAEALADGLEKRCSASCQ